MGTARAGGPDWARLRAHLDGDVVLPGDAAYPVAKQLASGTFDHVNPAAVAYCESTADVRTCLLFARDLGIRVAPRSGGHSAAGYSTTTGLVLDTSRLDRVHVGPSTVTFGPGLQGVDAVAALAPHGLAMITGNSPTVRAGGYLQGGGLGPLSRKYGVGCDRLVSAEVVLASGRVVRCDAHTAPDLFWALRGGGGGNFGVVTRFEVRPVSITRLPTYLVMWPWAAAARVVAAYQEWLVQAPDDLDTNLTIVAPGPEPVVLVSGSWLGPGSVDAQLDALIAEAGAPLSRTVTELSYRDAMMTTFGCADKTVEQCHRVGDNPAAVLPRHTYSYGRGRMISQPLTAAAIDEALTAFDAPSAPGQFRAMGLSGLAGRMNTPARTDTAYVHRTSLALFGYAAGLPGFTPTPEEQTASDAWLDGGMAVATRHGNGESYVNTVDARLPDWRTAYYGENYERLVRVKRRYDPYTFFRFPQAIGT